MELTGNVRNLAGGKGQSLPWVGCLYQCLGNGPAPAVVQACSRHAVFSTGPAGALGQDSPYSLPGASCPMSQGLRPESRGQEKTQVPGHYYLHTAAYQGPQPEKAALALLLPCFSLFAVTTPQPCHLLVPTSLLPLPRGGMARLSSRGSHLLPHPLFTTPDVPEPARN